MRSDDATDELVYSGGPMCQLFLKPFGETTPPYYCRHQLGREEQGCTSSSGGPSTEPHGSPTATLAAPAPRAPLARPSSQARSVSSASCRPGWGLRDRPSIVLSASHSTGRSCPKPTTPGIAGPLPSIRGTLPTISCECATMPLKPDGNRPQIP